MARKKMRPPQKLAMYEPHSHQVDFHKDTHKYRALVTGIGAGKTRMGVEEIIKWTQIYPGSLGVIGRLTAKSLRETTQRRFFEVCPHELIEDFNKSEGHLWIRTNAIDEKGRPVYSEILFMHLDDAGPLGSLDISYYWIDEAHEPDGTEVPESTFRMLVARLRHPVGPHRGFVTSNSGGKDWVYRWFFKPGHSDLCIGWTANTESNAKYLPPGYATELRANNPETWVKRYLDASFDAFEGQVFVEFNHDTHTYEDRTVEISPLWDHGTGFDFGVTAPTCCEYGAMDRDGGLWVYGEDYEPNADIPAFAMRMKRAGFKLINADPSVVAKGPDRRSPSDLYAEEGITLIPASNDEDYFIKLVKQLMSKGLLHIARSCSHLIDQIEAAAWDPKVISVPGTKEKMKVMENHALDAFKYLVNTLGLNPGLFDPITPGEQEPNDFVCQGEWEHHSFLEDEDLEDEDYPHKYIQRMVM